MKKKEVIQVELKPRLDFMAKFYLTFIILFVLFVAYIVGYRYIHRDEIIERLEKQNNQTVVENITEENN